MAEVRVHSLLLLVLLSGCHVGPGMEPAPALEITATPAELAAEVVAGANAERARHGLPRLVPDPALVAAAQDFATELARRGTLSHTSDRAGYTALMDRLDRAGCDVVRAGENIALLSARANLSNEVVRLWLRSPGHRRSLLNDAYTSTGAGSARGDRNTWYFVQVYATPPAGH